MLSKVSNLNTEYSHRSWQSQRKSKGVNIIATKNTAPATTDVSITQAAYQYETLADFVSWLDDAGTSDPLDVSEGSSHGNWVKRRINKVEQYVRPVCSLSCNTPDDVFYDFVQLAGQDSSEDKLPDGAVTYLLREGVWTVLGREGYAEWATQEAARIAEDRSVRMRGTATARAAKVSGLETALASQASEIEQLKASLAAALEAMKAGTS